MTTIDRVKVIYEAEVGKFKSNVSTANTSVRNFTSDSEKSVSGLKKSITSLTPAVKGLIAAFTVGAIVSFTKKLADQADQLDKLSTRLGASTEALSELKFVADQSGISFQNMTLGLQRMNRRISEAAKGSGEAKAALKELDISARDLNQLPLDQQFEVIAEALSKLKNSSDRTRLAMRFFDSEGVALTQTMKNGAQGIRDMRKQARELGLSLSQKDIKAIVKAKDEIAKMISIIETFGIKALGVFAEKFNSLSATLDKFSDQISAVKDGLMSIYSITPQAQVMGALFGGDDAPNTLAEDKLGFGGLGDPAKQGGTVSSLGPAVLVNGDSGGLSSVGGADQENPDLEKLKKQKEEEFLFLQGEWERRLELDRDKEAERQRIVDGAHSKLFKQQQNYIKVIGSLEKASAGQRLAIGVDMFTQLLGAAAQHNKTLFTIHKAAGIANAVVATYQAATQAFRDVPYPLNFAAAAAVTAAGVANIAQIASTQFNAGGSGGGASASSSSPAAPAAPATPAAASGGGASGGGGSSAGLDVNISGISPEQLFTGTQVTALIGAINEQIEDGANITGIRIS